MAFDPLVRPPDDSSINFGAGQLANLYKNFQAGQLNAQTAQQNQLTLQQQQRLLAAFPACRSIRRPASRT
jgi:hypothetical protein